MTQPGTAMPTLEEVAARAGVSRSTASRAINGADRVSPAAREAVAAAVRDLGFTPNRAARSLVRRRTDSIALIVPEPDERALSDPFVAAILTGVSNHLADSDIQVVLVIARPDGVERTLRFLRGGHVDGAVVVSHHRGADLLAALTGLPLPVVFVGRPLLGDDSPPVDCVDTDNEADERLVTTHLVERGRRRIGTVAGPADMSAAVDRLAGWRTALDAAGLPDDAVEHGDFTMPGGQAATHRLLDAHPELDAIVAASDLMAAGALAALHARGRRVPDDVAVVGYDDLGLAATTRPPLTTVAQPVAAMSRAAADHLLALLAGGAPRGEVFPGDLRVRRSS